MEFGSAFHINLRELFDLTEEKKKVLPIEKCEAIKSQMNFESGRNAIEYVFKYCLKYIDKKVALVPVYLCDSIVEAIERAGWKCRYYNICDELKVDKSSIEMQIREASVLFFVDYFGKTMDLGMREFLEVLPKDYIIIEDITQSLLSEIQYDDRVDYFVGSIRKWFALPDGGAVWSRHQLPQIEWAQGISEYTMYYFLAQLMKGEYLNDISLDKNSYLEWMKYSVKKLFEDYTIRPMSKIAEKLLRCEDIERISKQRRENYFCAKHLIESEVPYMRVLGTIKEGEVPFCIPVMVSERDELKKFLIEKEVYCNIHWNIEEDSIQYKYVYNISKNILSLPCDQRYSLKDMQQLVERIKGWK